MIVLIGGVPRSGKTLLAGRLSVLMSLPVVHLDIFRQMFEKAEPDLGIANGNDPDVNASRLWKFIKAYALEAEAEGYGCILEGSDLLPALVSELLPSDSVRAAFLGYSANSVEDKIAAIRSHPDNVEWTANMSEDQLRELVQKDIQRSGWLKAECGARSIHYFDVGEDFEQDIAEIVTALA